MEKAIELTGEDFRAFCRARGIILSFG